MLSILLGGPDGKDLSVTGTITPWAPLPVGLCSLSMSWTLICLILPGLSFGEVAETLAAVVAESRQCCIEVF